MPIYEYLCEKCEHEFERSQRITEDPVKTCPSCRSRKVKRLISQTSFVLKGGGWYNDLYSSSKDSKDGKDAKDDGKDKSSSKDTSADSKSGSDAASTKTPSDDKPKKGKSGSKAKKSKKAAA